MQGMKKPFAMLGAVVFALVALVHLLRLVYGWEVTINGSTVPMWVSVVGVVIPGALAAGLWWESSK
jgi:protein-S-isoprenylcysteine O-methyltransferase Ste14